MESQINVEFATELVAWMRKRAETLPSEDGGPFKLMSDWQTEVQTENFCGTVGCISGEAALLAFDKGLIKELRPEDFLYGERWLGDGTRQLFSSFYWPRQFKNEYDRLTPGDYRSEMLLMADVLEDAVVRQQEKGATK